MISRITLSSAAIGIAALMSSTASAGCGNSLYCDSNVSQYESAPSIAYGSSSAYSSRVTLPETHGTIGNYGSSSYSSRVTLPETHGMSSSYSTSSYGGVASDSYADSVYGSGSISGPYVDSSSVGSTYRSATISNLSLPGLGVNERLVPTSCGVNVHGAEGAKVLGCYNVAQPVQVYTLPPVPVQTYVRVVRPIIYVRYPVPVPVAVPTCGSTWSARYTDHGSRRCGW